MTHVVEVLCKCEDIEQCRMERYIADIRTLLTLYGDPLAPKSQGLTEARHLAVREVDR